jgi:hypothetical protein
MITIQNQLCYSPRPPEAYTHNNLGIGNWVKGDIQLWNLLYLSVPELDQYLDGVSVTALPSFMEQKRASYVGEVMACLDPKCPSHDHTRELLKRDPVDFVKGLVKTPFQILPTYVIHGMKWIETMRERASMLSASVAKVEAVQGNVVYAKFGRA